MRRFCALALSGLLLPIAPLSADVVIDWNLQATSAIRATNTNPPRASRAMAITHLAIYDAVNCVLKTHEPYLVFTTPPEQCSADAAAAQAAYRVLSTLFPSRQAQFDAALAASTQGIPEPDLSNGLALGQACAVALLEARATDGSDANVPYTPGDQPGEWRPTPPAYAPALLPGWGDITPFGMTSDDQFLPAPPPALEGEDYMFAYFEVQDIGRVDSDTRTEEQSEIALFWADGANTETPPGHWNSIARIVAAQNCHSIGETARLFALLNIATADAAISCWNTKYTYDFWRPVTAIREGDNDNNPCTIGDPTWSSFITTPPFPSYTSGHSTFSGASSTVLARFFNNDDMEFSSTSDGLPGVTRDFTSFSQAAAEAADSRLYGGIHWRFDNEAGLYAGIDLGNFTFSNYLRTMGDMDCDGMLIAADIDAFVMALEDPIGYQTCFPACARSLADMNHDGRINNFDINPFVDALMSGG